MNNLKLLFRIHSVMHWIFPAILCAAMLLFLAVIISSPATAADIQAEITDLSANVATIPADAVKVPETFEPAKNAGELIESAIAGEISNAEAFLEDYLQAEDKLAYLQELTSKGRFYRRNYQIAWSEFLGEELLFPASDILDLYDYYGICIDDAGILPVYEESGSADADPVMADAGVPAGIPLPEGLLKGENRPLYMACSLLTDYYSDREYASAIVDLCTEAIVFLQTDWGFPEMENGFFYTSSLITHPAPDLSDGEAGDDFPPHVDDQDLLQDLNSDVISQRLVDDAILRSYEDSKILLAYTEEDPTLKALRSTADGLEEIFGITILFPGQYEDTGIWADYEFSGDADLITPESIRNALETLNAELARYPEGFFRQFASARTDRIPFPDERPPSMVQDNVAERLYIPGIRFLFTGSIEGEVAAAGLTRTSHRTIDIALNILDASDLLLSIHHEIAHAIDFHISRSYQTIYNDTVWDRLNPEGLAYAGTKESYFDLKEFTFTDDLENEIYYYDPYARTSPQEDRARIFECAACPQIRQAEDFFALGHPREKLALLCRAIRAVFDDSTWKELPFWERFLIPSDPLISR